MVTVTAEGDQNTWEAQVDEAMSGFDEYFTSIQGSSRGLIGVERAAIKSFCAFMLGIRPDPPPAQGEENG